MKYRMYQDQANLYLVRYEEDSDNQWYFANGNWHGFPQSGFVEPMVIFPGRALVEQLKGSLR